MIGLEGANRRQAAERFGAAPVGDAESGEHLVVGQPGRRGERAQRRRHVPSRRGHPQDARVQRGRPAVLGRQPALERRHRSADRADADAAIVVEGGDAAEGSAVGQVGGRGLEPGGEGAVSAPDGAVAARTVGLVDLRAARKGGRLGRQLVERDPEALSKAVGQRADVGVERVGGSG